MISIDTTVQVGDKKPLSVDPSADGQDVVLSMLEATFTSPSGIETVYTKSDFTESGGTYVVSHEFDEAGHWHVRVVAEGGSGRETDAGYVRAVETKPTEQLSVLTMDVWPEYLSEAAMTESPEAVGRLAALAERKVIDRYRETRPRTDNVLDSAFDKDVHLDGWAEDDGGDPDLQEMDAGLLDALRESVALIIEWHVNKPGESVHIDSMSQGDRSVSYRDKELPSSVYAPLRPYDDRPAIHFGLC